MFLANVDCQRGLETNQTLIYSTKTDKLSVDDLTSEILLLRSLILICIYAAQENRLNF